MLGFYPLAMVIGAYNQEDGSSPTLCELIDSLDSQCLVVVGSGICRTLELANDWRRVV